MKNKIISGLLFIIAFSVVLQSCRNDYLTDQQETYHNSSAFRPTSKTISLNESKHKDKLIPEIENIETGLKRTVKTNAQERVIQYGNGVSIDTDEVIYIENGPNYHTYTFRINRENASEDAPVENLVLSPLADGTYKELLITYNFTPQEKQTLMKGGFVNTNGKTTVTELAKGTYGGVLGKMVESCSYQTVTMIFPCSSSDQHTSADECDLTGDDAPKSFTTVAMVCTSLDDGTGNGGSSPSSPGSPGTGTAPGTGGGLGNGNDGGGGNNDFPSNNDCNGISTNPQGASTDISDGCNSIPTQPNLSLPSFTDPCKKAKASMENANAVLKNTEVQQKMDAVLKGKADASNEWAIAVGFNFATSQYIIEGPVEGTNSTSTPPSGNLGDKYIADGHTHAKKRGSPSAADLYGILNLSQIYYMNFRNRYVYGINNGVPEVYALVVTDKTLAGDFLTNFLLNENYDDKTHWFKRGSKLWKDSENVINIYKHNNITNTSGENHDEYALALAYILDKHNSGISLAKADADGNLKKVNVSVEPTTTNGFPDEKIVVSKCP